MNGRGWLTDLLYPFVAASVSCAAASCCLQKLVLAYFDGGGEGKRGERRLVGK